MKRSKHNLSHYHLTTGDMGHLLPVGFQEVLPNDTFRHSTSMLIRLSPMAAPVMHPITVRLHTFFVPTRLIWDGFEDFITGGLNGNNQDTVPTFETPAPGSGLHAQLCDHLGLPTVEGLTVSQLPLKAYGLIFNEFYRDQDLTPEIDIETPQDIGLRRICWEKDYFTTSRPWEQKGPSVTIPIGTEAPVYGNSALTFTTGLGGAQNAAHWAAVDTSPVITNSTNQVSGNLFIANKGHASPSGLYADLTDASASTINELRTAFALQRFAEARARYGSRYAEYIRYLGARNRDGRLDRPEYLGGGKANVNISEVLQTGPETRDDPGTAYGVGDLYGHGISALRSRPYIRTFDEHGYVMSLLSVRPKAMYQDGIPRTWLRQYREDYFQKELQFVGQQETKLGEIYAEPGNEHQVFGYGDRYGEYRRANSQVSGEFRDLLDFWHLGRQFESAPALNHTFVSCTPSRRIFNVQDHAPLWCAVQHRIGARRIVSRNAAGKMA